MVFATDWQVGQVFLSMLELFFFIIWIWLLIAVFSDLFRDHEMSGWGKAAWAIFVILFPFLGVFVYLIARGGSMHERALAQQAQAQKQFNTYVQQAVGTTGGSGGAGNVTEELSRLADLKAQGVISDDEFATLKAKAMASS
ncbi:MAG: SHOCT domain-containing protein [Acidimicrobiia bacterium]